MNAQIAEMLRNFVLSKLDVFERRQYTHFIKQSTKEQVLQVLINSVDGDYSQLSPELARIAEMQDRLQETVKNIKKFLKEIFLKKEDDEVYIEEHELNEIMKGYLECAIWTEEERLKEDYNGNFNSLEDYEEDGEDSEIEKLIHLQNNLNTKPFSNFIEEDIEPDSKIQAYLDIKNFIKLAGPQAISEALDANTPSRLGHDIWLTRNHHGAGFFDHSYDFEKQLMDAAHAIKEVDLFLTDNLTLAFSNAHS